jgi:hypothetical protein
MFEERARTTESPLPNVFAGTDSGGGLVRSTMEQVTLDELDARPHAAVFESGPKTVRLALDAGDGVAAHSHPGKDVLFHVLDGEIDVVLDDEETTVTAGDVMRFDGEREVAPSAVTDARALVVLAPRGDE